MFEKLFGGLPVAYPQEYSVASLPALRLCGVGFESDTPVQRSGPA